MYPKALDPVPEAAVAARGTNPSGHGEARDADRRQASRAKDLIELQARSFRAFDPTKLKSPLFFGRQGIQEALGKDVDSRLYQVETRALIRSPRL